MSKLFKNSLKQKIYEIIVMINFIEILQKRKSIIVAPTGNLKHRFRFFIVEGG